jgi:TonB-dependent receptor
MRYLIPLFCFVCLLAPETLAGDARSIREVKVSLNLANARLEEALVQIEEQTEFRFVYSSENVDKDQLVNLKVYEVSVAYVLEELFRGKNLIIRQRDYQVMIKGYHHAPRPKIVVEQEYGGVIGTVTDQITGEGLPGATVTLKGTSIGTVTDIDGDYLLVNVPVGRQTIVYRFLGFEPREVTLDIEARTTLNEDVQLLPVAIETEEVVITGQALGQQAAINQQISANTIVSIVSQERIEELPDQNAAESVGRLPGIAIQRNAGEGQKVVVRGLSPRFNAITVNGERIPSTDPRDRSVDLSMISPEQLAGIEVFKALRPDQDGDAIGGTVNFVVKRASEDWQGTLRAQTGYNSIADEWGQYRGNASLSNRFFNNKLGVLVTGNYQRANRSSDVLGADWQTLVERPDLIRLESSTLSDIIEVRRRYGGSLAVDYDLGVNSSILLSTLWGETDREELRRRRSFDVRENFQDYELLERSLNTRLITNSLSGDHSLANQSWQLEWRASYSTSRQTTPFSHRMRFREVNAFDFAAGGPPTGAGPAEIVAFANNDFANAFLRRGEIDDDLTVENIYTAQSDLKKVLNFGSGNRAYVKGGLKYRRFDRRKDAVQFSDQGNGAQDGFEDFLADFPNEYELTPSAANQDISMTNFLGNYRAEDFLDNSVDFGPGLDPFAIDRFAILFAPDYYYPNSLIDNADYEALEQISAGYLMAEVDFGRLMLLGGARVEHTNAEYLGYRTAEVDQDDLDAGEEGVAFREAQTSDMSYTELLPMFHARYKFTDWFDVRLAATRSLARPNFQNLVPWQRIQPFESQAELGNPTLRHLTAWNFDVFLSFYRSFGLFTVGLFQKELTNIDVDYRFTETDRRDALFGYEVLQPINVTEPTTVRGVEIDFQANLLQLPSPFNGVVFSANVTFIESSTQYPFFERRGDSGAPLFTPRFVDDFRPGRMPGQPDLTANVSLGYERGGFSGRVSMIVQDDSFDELGSRPQEDSFSNLLLRLDAVASYDVNDNFQLFVNWNNITDAPIESFQFQERFLTAQEYFGFTADLGLRYRFGDE